MIEKLKTVRIKVKEWFASLKWWQIVKRVFRFLTRIFSLLLFLCVLFLLVGMVSHILTAIWNEEEWIVEFWIIAGSIEAGEGPALAQFVGYIFGGVLLILQIIISNLRATAAEDTAKAMQQTAETTERGNVAERFKNAVEHLGNEDASVRLSGIYALHYIADEAEEYSERVFEILCAHVRETTTKAKYKPQKLKNRQRKIKIIIKGTIEKSFVPVDSIRIEPTVEIQSILNLLIVKPEKCRVYKGYIVNLAGSNLRGAMLVDIQRKNQELVGANLEHADFTHADLRDTFLPYAKLQGAIFNYSKLQKAYFGVADLSDAYLEHSEIQNAEFDHAILSNTLFTESNLQGAKFLSSQYLTAAQLMNVETLYKAVLPDSIEQEIKNLNPSLFEKPKDK